MNSEVSDLLQFFFIKVNYKVTFHSLLGGQFCNVQLFIDML